MQRLRSLGKAYARARYVYFGTVNTVEQWLFELLFEEGAKLTVGEREPYG